MKRFTFAVAATIVACALSVATAGAAAAHTEFAGGVGTVNTCNGEIINGTGPVKIVLTTNENETKFGLHLTFDAEGTGDLGNDYIFRFEANDQFDEPSGSLGGGVTFFDVPIHAEVISEGGAPNFAWDLGIRIFVQDGAPTGAFLIGPETRVCHG